MKAKLVKIGNSRGIRIPKPVVEQCGFGDTVELRVRGETLVIKKPRAARAGWDEALAEMAQTGDDRPLDPEAPTGTDWDKAEWRW